MPNRIIIRDVPEHVCDELASRAALRSQTLEEYLRSQLEKMVSQTPTITNRELMRRVRKRKKSSGANVTTSAILRARDADRR